MTKHWTRYLPEAGEPLTKQGDEVQRLRAEAARLLTEAQKLDKALQMKAWGTWTRAEIEDAIEQAKEQ